MCVESEVNVNICIGITHASEGVSVSYCCCYKCESLFNVFASFFQLFAIVGSNRSFNRIPFAFDIIG